MNNPSEYIESDTFYKVVHQIVQAQPLTYNIALNTIPMDFSGLVKIYLRSFHMEGISGTDTLVRINLDNPQPFAQTNIDSNTSPFTPSPSQTLAVIYINKDTRNAYGLNSLTEESVITNISPNSYIAVSLKSIFDAVYTAYSDCHIVLDIHPLRRRENRGDAMVNMVRSM